MYFLSMSLDVDIYTPRTIKYEWHDYVVKNISKYAFKDNKQNKSIYFASD